VGCFVIGHFEWENYAKNISELAHVDNVFLPKNRGILFVKNRAVSHWPSSDKKGENHPPIRRCSAGGSARIFWPDFDADLARRKRFRMVSFDRFDARRKVAATW
jgi:hypothetical protein